ncbi:MAG: carboxypeptidase-like regulatory domain-containing protein [Saprospiraceae bacterium]|nr:carboxypeptidase-like regulatory domain-containing protein [Saprospiraceae bacterium]
MPIFKNNFRWCLPLLFLLEFWQGSLSAQQATIVQFSGIVYQKDRDILSPLPYVNVGILRNRQATYTNEYGFYSIAVQAGDTLLFQYLGFKNKKYTLPLELPGNSLYAEIILERDTFQLSKATVYPIPSKEHFKQEFLAMDVRDEMKEIAQKNLASDVLAWIEPGVAPDPGEGVSAYFRTQANKAVYAGQFQPLQIFNPLAWIDFINALKKGEFKKKKKPPK